MITAHLRPALVPAAVVSIAIAAPIHAEFVPELPALEPRTVGARSAGLGGAGIAASDESAALLLNPAALPLGRRGEASLGIAYQRAELESRTFDQVGLGEATSGELSDVGIVHPIPVYRGAFSVGFLFHRTALLDRELVRSAVHPNGDLEDEVLSEQGAMNVWAVGGGVQVSPRAFLGASVGVVSGELQRESELVFDDVSSAGLEYAFRGADTVDLSGLRASIGGLVFPSSRVRVGFRLDLPYSVSYEGTQEIEGDESVYRLDDEVSYPLRVGIGAAARHHGWMGTLDLVFAPYSLIELNGNRQRTETRIEGYRDVVTVSAGVEVTLPVPVRLRAGYRFDPDPYRLLVTEVRNEDPALAVMEEVSFTENRHTFSGGVGMLMEGAIRVDAAVEWTHAKKNATNVGQTDDRTRLTLTTAYRY